MKMILRIHAGSANDHLVRQHFSDFRACSISQSYPIFDGEYLEPCAKSLSTRDEDGVGFDSCRQFNKLYHLRHLVRERDESDLPF